jgi:hypothetical protein
MVKKLSLAPTGSVLYVSGFTIEVSGTMESRMIRLRDIPLQAIAVLLAAGLSSCASLRLEPTDFGWPVEGVLTVSAANTVEEPRQSITFSVAALAAEEFQDTSALKGTALRVLRNPEGYFFVTGPRFEHVYVFAASGGALCLEKKIRVTPEHENGRLGLRNPALNQRPPYIELLGEPGVRILLTQDGIVEQSSAKGGNE